MTTLDGREIPSREAAMPRVGAVCAIVGSIVSVAAGIGFGNITNELGTEEVLREIAARPGWYWPTVHLAFIVGAFLWVGAFVAIATSVERGVSWTLASLGVAAVIVGAAIHVVDSSISGFGLAALANDWEAAAAPERAELVRIGDALLHALNGTWRSVHSYFHGVPFILASAAATLSPRYPTWLGWFGIVGGAGSFLGGVLQFLDVIPGTERRVIIFAQAVSLWMVAMGMLMWRHARDSAR